MYAYYANISRDEARDSIAARLKIDEQDQSNKRKRDVWKAPVIKEYPAADVDTRDATYRAMLSRLTLASDHRANLLGRGLT